MPQSFYRLKIAAVLLSCITICSCTNDTDGDGIANDIDKCPTVFARTKDGCPVAAQVGTVHFFIDKSGSMGGYYKKGAKFTDDLTDLIYKTAQHYSKTDIWYSAEQTEKYSGSLEQFASDIANKEPKPGKSSQLDEIFETIAGKTDSNDISVFASDCILSFSDAEIRANPEINKEKTGFLKNKINKTFFDLNKRGFGASVYALTSKFNGLYYDYQNHPKMLSGEERPFYIWVIGNKDLLAKFDAQLADISTFTAEKKQELHFGLSDKPVTGYNIIPSVSRKGNWMENGDHSGIEEIGDAKKTPTQFCVAVDLSRLPPYAQRVSYLKDNLKTDAHDCTATITVLDKKDADITKLHSEPQKAALEKSTHVLLVEVTDMALKNATVNITLPLRTDTWYTDWSCMDDRNLAADCARKTFALEYLITGVKEAYETKNDAYVNFTLKLQQ